MTILADKQPLVFTLTSLDHEKSVLLRIMRHGDSVYAELYADEQAIEAGDGEGASCCSFK